MYAPLGSVNVVSNTPFQVHFSRLLDPATATRQSICIQPLTKTVVTSAECTAGVFLAAAYDPVRRELTYRQSPTKPPLLPGQQYTVTAYVPTDASPSGFRSFEGTPLAATFTGTFVVSADTGAPPPYDTLGGGNRFCTSAAPTCSKTCVPTCTAKFAVSDPREQACEGDCLAACPRSVIDILGGNGCAFASCHGPPLDGGTFEPEGLIMSSVAALHATAIGRVAHETQTGEAARTPNEAPSRFGRAMPILDPLAPGNSYLIYKLLANSNTPLTHPFPDTPAPGTPGEAPEVHRIRSSLVVGMPMPPSGNNAYLRDGEIEWLSDWILQGAPTPSCK